MINAITTLAILGVVVPFYFHRDMQVVRKQISRMTWSEILIFLGIGLAGVVTGAIGISMLAHHGVAYYKISNEMTEILAGIIGMIVFTRKGLAWQQKLGVGLMGAGAYLFM